MPASESTPSHAFRLGSDAVRRFEEQGFVSGIPVLDGQEIAEFRRRLEDLGERLPSLQDRLYEVELSWLERPDEVVLHFLGAWRVDPAFRALVFRPAVTMPLAQLLGVRRLRFWHDQVFWKPPRHPGVVPWHQDYSYWTRTSPANHITMFISLDDMEPENGGLQYVPGSHRWGLLPRVDFGGQLEQLHGALDARQRGAFAPEPVRLRAGEAAVHHSHTVHGSLGNGSGRPRRAIVLNYMGANTRCADGSAPLLAHTPRFAEGARIEGADFPIALDLDEGGAARRRC